mmetsp:Transcript_77027/g.222752  ORF Transcript_77027/g.222752 Transcript_77027/m.222752 type:complete len:469 (+) Transcript_77027:90-1496(+)
MLRVAALLVFACSTIDGGVGALRRHDDAAAPGVHAEEVVAPDQPMGSAASLLEASGHAGYPLTRVLLPFSVVRDAFIGGADGQAPFVSAPRPALRMEKGIAGAADRGVLGGLRNTLLSDTRLQHTWLPSEWADKINHDTIHARGPKLSKADRWRANLVASPTVEVAFEVRTTNPEVERGIRIMELTRSMPGIICLYDHASVGGVSWTMTENVGDTDLWSYFRTLKAKRPERPQGGVWMELDHALPLLVDVLRGVVSLDSRGLVHMDMTGPSSVVLVPDYKAQRDRALISNLGRAACVLDGSDRDLSCDAFCAGRIVGSAIRQAPEMERGMPLGPKCNVWQVGLVFAKMCMGMYPTDEVVLEHIPDVHELSLDFDFDGREQIREVIREEFDVRGLRAFEGLFKDHPEVADLVAGMLQVDPEKRWSVEHALIAAIGLTRYYQIPVPEERVQTVPSAWHAAVEEVARLAAE